MSKRFDEELSKLTYASLEKIGQNEYYIKRNLDIRLEENNCYLLQLDSILLNVDSALATNWNKGKAPKCKYYKVEVDTIMGNMIKVVGVGSNDISFIEVIDHFYGWLPIDNIKVLEKV